MAAVFEAVIAFAFESLLAGAGKGRAAGAAWIGSVFGESEFGETAVCKTGAAGVANVWGAVTDATEADAVASVEVWVGAAICSAFVFAGEPAV